MKDKVVTFVRKNTIYIVIASGLFMQYFYDLNYWVFVILVGASLLEKKTLLKIALVFLVTCAYVIMYFVHRHTRNSKTMHSQDNTDDCSKNHTAEKLFYTEWTGPDDVFVLKLDREKEERYAKLVHNLYSSYNAIIFSCRIDKKIFNLFLTQIFDFSYYRTITNSLCNIKIEKNNIILTYISISAEFGVFRISHKKNYAVVLNNMCPAINLKVFDSLIYKNSLYEPGKVYLKFIKFYPLCTWNELRKIMTGSEFLKPSCTSYYNIEELDDNNYERLCDLLCISPKDYDEFRFLFVTQDELNSMMAGSS